MIKYVNTVFVFLLSYLASAQVVINELDSDTPSTDDKEFIELKSAIPNFSLNGYVLVFFNGTGSQANISYYVVDLDGNTTDANGIFVIGNNLVSPVPLKFLPDSVIQNGPDGVALYLGNETDFPNATLATINNLVDALIYDTNDVDATSLMALLGITSQIDENANSQQTLQSIQRKIDGTYEIKTPTPGVNNDGSGIIFNGIQISTINTQFGEGQNFNITFTTQTNVSSNLNFSFTIANGNFNNTDYTGSLAVTIPIGSNSFSTNITLIDDVFNEGDEILNINFNTIPFGYSRMNDNIEIRIIDNDFTISPWGTPLNPTYDIVSSTAPTGYYAPLEGKSGLLLKQAVQDIISNPLLVHAHNYGDVEAILKKADQNPLNSNEVWLMYVEEPRSKLDIQETGINTGKWNREHIYPQSRGGYTDGTESIPDGIDVWLPTNADDILAGHADAHHIRAEDGPENSIRSNKDYGEYLGPIGSQGSWHGDVARSLFYMAVRYNGLSVVNGNPSNTTVGQLGDLSLLLQWNQTDPSDDFEMNRNNYIYTWQINRNPFIDYPELADYIWGDSIGQPWFPSLKTTYFTDSKIIVYPNPANDYVYISGIKEESKIQIYSISGAKLLETTMATDSILNFDLASGMYLLKITSEGKSIVKKLMIR